MRTRTSSIYDRLETNGKYEVQQYTYPNDLTSEGNGHWIFMTINSVIGSKLERNSRAVQTVDGISSTPRVQQNNEIGNRERFGGKALTKKIDTAIALHMPMDITISQEMNWENSEINAGVALQNLYNGVTNTFNNFDNSLVGDILSLNGDVFNTDNISRNLLDFTQTSLGNLEAANAISFLRRQFRNPYMEFLFRGISPRTFSLNFKFMPKSLDESNNVRNIIQKIKEAASPELISTGGVLGSFYNYPSEFDILFMTQTSENNFLHKVSTCVLTNINVNYTPSGEASFFEEIPGDGAPPTGIEMTLEFTELELMSADRARLGF